MRQALLRLKTTKNREALSAVEHQTEGIPDAVDDVLCRLAQANPAQTPERWERITEGFINAMARKSIPLESLKPLVATEHHLCLPRSWRTEMTKLNMGCELATQEQATKESDASILVRKSYSKGTNDLVDDQKQDAQEENEVELDLRSNMEGSSGEAAGSARAASKHQVREGSVSLPYREASTSPLTKYDVFSLMRRVHEQVGPRVIENEGAMQETLDAGALVRALFEELPVAKVKAMSQESRRKGRCPDGESLAYGEIDLDCFLQLLVKLKRVYGAMMVPGGSFWDLGAGMGKLVIAAAVMHDFDSCYGVEISEDMRDASRPLLKRWRKEVVSTLPTSKADIRVDFMCGDLLKQLGWVTEATLLYINTDLSATNTRQVREKTSGMKVGAICLSVSLPAVDEDKWGLLGVERVDTSWGKAKLYIHEKLVA